jgi:hypothetical protein
MTRQEHATLLTGLRMIQSQLINRKRGGLGEIFTDLITAGGELEPLTVAQIDDLAARLDTLVER